MSDEPNTAPAATEPETAAEAEAKRSKGRPSHAELDARRDGLRGKRRAPLVSRLE